MHHNHDCYNKNNSTRIFVYHGYIYSVFTLAECFIILFGWIPNFCQTFFLSDSLIAKNLDRRQ